MAQRQRAQVGRKTQSKHGFVERFFRVTPTRNAAFISKLFSMVDDETTNDLITWTGSGDQFTVFNNTEFSRIVLPRYFKHCNWSSFVRQLNMYDFHKINDNSNEEELKLNNINNQVINGEQQANIAASQRWDFKHPCFNKAGFDRLHKIRRKPPRNRLIPQIRYSSAMEIVPSNSPDYEGEPSRTSSASGNSNDMDSSASGQLSRNVNSGQALSPAVHDVIHQLQHTIGGLESRLNSTASEVQYLRTVTDTQQEILNDILTSVEYLKSKYNITENIPNMITTSRKPRKIHELLGSSAESQHIEFGRYHMDTRKHHEQQHHNHHRHAEEDSRMEEASTITHATSNASSASNK